MERLTSAHEHLDGPLDDDRVLAGNLRDLRRVNRLLGGVRMSRLAIDRLLEGTSPAGGGRVSIVDVGTGGADIPVALLADARRRKRELTVVAVDSRREVIDAARQARPGIETVPGLILAVADGTALPYPDGSFDVAHSSLVVHHLDAAAAVPLIREMARVARVGIVVNDVSRGRLQLAGAWLLSHLLTRNPFTRDDAPLSVRRAFTRAEMTALIEEAGLRPVATIGGFVGHRYAIAAVRR
jgi:ubiquinone/menaquinone biosynthesis C-methylase UbiE